MSVCTGTRVRAKTGVPLSRSGDVVINGSGTLMVASCYLPTSNTPAKGWLTTLRFSGGAERGRRKRGLDRAALPIVNCIRLSAGAEANALAFERRFRNRSVVDSD